jgi:hypothetical protein
MKFFAIHRLKNSAILWMLLLVVNASFSQEKSYKRGVSYGFHSATDMQKFSEAISWWYNWSPQPDAAIQTTYQNYDVDFTPMAWNASGISGVNSWVSQDPNVNYILGFNEPNFKEQANMTPSEAAAAWPAFQQIAIDNNLKTVGPAVNYCGDCVSEGGTTYNNPFKYLDDFFAACTNCEVDYIALHWYGSGNSIVGYVNDARKYGKPIWVTEFSSWDASNPVVDVEQQKNYLAGTVNFLERDPDVYRYSWFIGRTNSGINTYPFIDLYGNPGEWTTLGEIYQQIPVYDPDMKFQIPGKIQAEEYFLMNGLFAELTKDATGFLNLGWTDNGDWASYKMNVAAAGTYEIAVRVAGTKTGAIEFLVDDATAATINTPNTGGWQTWKTVYTTINLTEGEHLLKMNVKTSGFNINWISILEQGTIPEDNFEIETIGETCSDKNNGQIKIKANKNYDYVATLNGVNYSFTSEKNITNLEPGSYDLCISISNTNFQQCYKLTIEEGVKVSGKATIKNLKATVEIEEGTAPFQVYQNGKLVLETSSPSFNLEVIHGDLIEVKTAQSCEGTFAKTINLLEDIFVYPNPTKNKVEITIPSNEKEISLQLFTVQGQLIEMGFYKVNNCKVILSLEGKPVGVYFVKVGNSNAKTLKIIKI